MKNNIYQKNFPHSAIVKKDCTNFLKGDWLIKNGQESIDTEDDHFLKTNTNPTYESSNAPEERVKKYT